MSATPDDGSLVPQAKNTALSAGALKAGLHVAAKEFLSPEQADQARQQRPYLRHLSDLSVRLAVKEPPMWEYRLYFQALKDFVEKEAADAQGTALRAASIAATACTDWMLERLDEYVGLADTIHRLVNTELQAAFGLPGHPGDAAGIVSVARKVAKVYRRFLDIRSEAQAQAVAPPLEEPAREFSRICDGTIAVFETYPKSSLDTLMTALADDDGETEVVLQFDMKLVADTDAFRAAIRRAQSRL
jgi:hypothetical protein